MQGSLSVFLRKQNLKPIREQKGTEMNFRKMLALINIIVLHLFLSAFASAQMISLPDDSLTNTKYCTWFGGYWDGEWTTSTIDAQNDTVVINGVISGISLHDSYLEIGFLTDRQYNFIMDNHPTEPEDWFNQGAYMLFYEWTSGGNWSWAQIQDYQGEGSMVALSWNTSYNFKVVFKPNLGGIGGTADLYMSGVLVESDHVYGTPQTPGWWSGYDTSGEEDFSAAHLIIQLWASVSGKAVSYSNLTAESISEYNPAFEIDVVNHLPDKVADAIIRTGVTAGETDDGKLVVHIPSGFQFGEPSGVPANTVVGSGYSEEDPSHLFTLKTTGIQDYWVMYSSIHGPIATVNVYPNDSLVYSYGDDGNLTQEFTWHLLLTLSGSLSPYGNVIQNPSTTGDYVFDAIFYSEAGQVVTRRDTVSISQPSEVWVDDGFDSYTPGWGYDHFDIIQDGVDAVAPSGTVNVLAGTYYENMVISKPLSLLGAGQDSVLVYTDSSDIGTPNPEGAPAFRGSQIVVVQATDVLIDGFTFDGDNPFLTPGGTLDARNGIITNGAAGNWNNLTVQNCTVKNIYLRGIYAAAHAANELTGINLNHNTVNNVKGVSFQSAGLMFWGASGSMTHNSVSNSSIGTMFHISSDGRLDSNLAATCEVGFAVNSNDQPTTISGNTVTSSGQGIQTISIDDLVTISGNDISNCTTGIVLYGGGDGLNDVVGNQVEGPGVLRATGLYASTDISPWGMGDVKATLSNNTIKNNFFGIIFNEPDTNNTKLISITVSGSMDNRNFIYRSSSFEVLMDYCDDDINAQYNYWGKSTIQEIEGVIYHQVDQPDLGSVDFSSPILHGDVNMDGEVTVADVVYLVNYIFKNGPEPLLPIIADINGNGEMTVEDVVYLTNYLFKSGPPPIPPSLNNTLSKVESAERLRKPRTVNSSLR